MKVLYWYSSPSTHSGPPPVGAIQRNQCSQPPDKPRTILAKSRYTGTPHPDKPAITYEHQFVLPAHLATQVQFGACYTPPPPQISENPCSAKSMVQ